MRTILLFCAALIAATAIGCKDNDTTTSTGSLPNGTLKGSVSIFDSLGTKLSDASGVTVTLEGTSYSATTSSDGTWVIPNLPTRTYTIVYSKSGLATSREAGFVFVGGDTVYHANTVLWMPIRQRVQLTGISTSAATISFRGVLPIAQPNYSWFALVGGVSADSAALANSLTLGTVTSVDYEVGSTADVKGFGVGLFTPAELQNAGFHSGQHLYAAVHIIGIGAGYQSYTYYLDNRTGQYVFPSAGPVSEVVGFTMP